MTNDQTTPTEVETPRCPRCGTPMQLERIEPEKPGHDRRIFRCQTCGEAVTETVKYR